MTDEAKTYERVTNSKNRLKNEKRYKGRLKYDRPSRLRITEGRKIN